MVNDELIDKILSQLDDERGDHRSWNHCHSIFVKLKNNPAVTKEEREKEIDLLCLHLAFFLASWGMYRGSSFLRTKDYTIHKRAIIRLLEEKYSSLWNIRAEDYTNNPEKMDLLFELSNNLREIYGAIKMGNKTKNSTRPVTDTLITKILLGTLACVPAYDRYFIIGLKKHGQCASFSRNGFPKIMELCAKNRKALRDLETRLSTDKGIAYSPMRVIDMLYWQIGKDSEENMFY